MQAVAWALTLGAVAGAGSRAAQAEERAGAARPSAQAEDNAKEKAKSAKSTKGDRPAAKGPVSEEVAEKPAPQGDRPKATVGKGGDAALSTLVHALRTALDGSRKAGDDPDLTTSLLSGFAEVSLVSVIHGHYAMAGVGQSLRTGGMPADEVKVVARDMERNFRLLAETYGRLAGHKPFPAQLTDIFRALQILCGKAEETSTALAAWAEASADGNKARAFETALGDYRGRVKALIAGLSEKK